MAINFFCLFFRLNSLLVPPLGFLMNFTLLWLILHRTPKKMWLHSRVLMQTCIMDILLLTLLLIGMPFLTHVQDKLIIFFDGYFVRFFYQKSLDFGDSRTALFHLFMAIHFLFHLDIFAITSQFLYRYLLLNRDVRINLRRYLFLLPLPFLLTIATTLTLYQIKRNENLIPNSTTQIPAYLSESIPIDFSQNPIYAVFTLNESARTLDIITKSLCYTITYSIVIFCYRQMVNYVNAHAMNERLKNLNKQLSKSLIICASYPLIFQASIVLILLLSTATKSMENAAPILAFSLVSWLPVLNPLASMWTFLPYRQTLMAPFKKAAVRIHATKVMPSIVAEKF